MNLASTKHATARVVTSLPFGEHAKYAAGMRTAGPEV